MSASPLMPPTAAKAFVFATDTKRFCFERRLATERIDPGKLSLLGGKLDAGETPLQGLQRELFEEAGLEHIEATHLTNKIGFTIFPDGRPSANRMNAYFLVRVPSEATLQITNQVANHEWYTFDEVLEQDLAAPAREIVLDLRTMVEQLVQ